MKKRKGKTNSITPPTITYNGFVYLPCICGCVQGVCLCHKPERK